MPWWSFKHEEIPGTDGYISETPWMVRNYDFGLFSMHYKESYPSFPSSYASYTYYDRFELNYNIFFVINFILVLVILAMMIILQILFVFKFAMKSRRNVSKFFIIPFLISTIVLGYFIGGFQKINYLSHEGLIGFNEYSYIPPGHIGGVARDYWGPSIGFYIFIVALIVLILLNIPNIKSFIEKRKEKKKKKMALGSSEKQDAS